MRRKRVIVILEGIEPTGMAAADVAAMINALCLNFRVTILTSAPAECRTLFPQATIATPMIRTRIRGGALAFFLTCWFVLPFLRGDLVYIPLVINLPVASLTFGRPVLCYGNSHPAQHALTARSKGGISSAIISKVYEKLMIRGLRRCNQVLAISPQLARVYESLGVPAANIRVLGLGVPISLFERKEDAGAQEHTPCTGVYHGTVSRERGLEIMVEGARILSTRRRDFMIRLVGCDAQQKRDVGQLTKAAGVEDLFEILPRLPHAEIPRILWSSSFGISLLEPNVYFAASPPVKVLEFLAAGLPVIANDLPTHSLYLVNRFNALVIPYDAGAFANAMGLLIENSSLREELSRNASKSGKDCSDLATMSKLVESAAGLMRR